MKTLFVAIVLMLVSRLAGAHSELPKADWCAGGRVVAVLPIKVPLHTLVTRGSMCRAEPPVPQTKECGQFDDDYDIARSAANGICQSLGYGLAGDGSDDGSVIFVPDAPASYLGPDHHEVYQLEHGLSGMCVRCEWPRSVVPPR